MNFDFPDFVTACIAAGFVILAASVLVSTTISAWKGR